jgi:TM2 domain-containing membrane protein YozV
MAKVIDVLPEITGLEMQYIHNLIQSWDDSKARNFANVYRARRRDPIIVLVTTLVGFFGVAGVQRFLTDQVGMGLLYLFTAGLCFVGTIIDAVNYQRLAFDYNRKTVEEVVTML